MFSHLIGNLVLRELDKRMLREAPGGYFRYVDDVALVAPRETAGQLEAVVARYVEDRGMALHGDKRL